MRIENHSAWIWVSLIVWGGSHLHAAQTAAPGGYRTIHNDFFWLDQNGDRILTRSGCLVQFGGVYYWYGGTQADLHRAQYCYTSTDLVHWTAQGVVLRCPVEANRIDVVYNQKTRQYVMALKYDGNGAHLGIATAERPEGPFTFRGQTLVENARMGDSSVYIDEEDRAYLCYVSWAVGTNAQHGIYLMSPDYLTLDKRIYLWDIRSREAPHLFKRNSLYYYGTSRTAGIESSGTHYYTAKDLAGPWSPPSPLATPGSTNSWDSQVDMVVPIRGKEGTVYLYFGDRWIKNVPEGRNGDYLFLPMEFDGDTPILNYHQDWEIDVAAGTWRRFDPGRNLAAGKKVTASSEDGNNVARNVTIPKTYRDYAKTYWQSGDGQTQWICVDLERPTQVNRVLLKWNTNAAREFKVQTSTDAAAWTDVFSTNRGASYTVTDETFETTTARYVRLVATERAPQPTRGRARGRGPQPDAQTGYSLFDFMVLKD
ncbi:MAG: family 43 glycosylhydrolase [Phycisphaerae bacterium]|nr:family 43 glycosylhydrolase [Phycisphaerae bacterium]